MFRGACTTSTWTRWRRTSASSWRWRRGARPEPLARCPTCAPATRAYCPSRPRRPRPPTRRPPTRRPPPPPEAAPPSRSTPTTQSTSAAAPAPRPPATRYAPGYSAERGAVGQAARRSCGDVFVPESRRTRVVKCESIELGSMCETRPSVARSCVSDRSLNKLFKYFNRFGTWLFYFICFIKKCCC